nr:hypothetical protein [Tanacetum cinerariifolium]
QDPVYFVVVMDKTSLAEQPAGQRMEAGTTVRLEPGEADHARLKPDETHHIGLKGHFQNHSLKLVPSRDKVVNMAARDFDDTLVRLADEKPLDIAGVGDVILKNSFGTRWNLKDLRIAKNMVAFKGNVPDVRKVDIYFYKLGGLGKQKKLYFIMSYDRYNANLQVECLKFDNGGGLRILEENWRGKDTSLAHLKAAAQMKCDTTGYKESPGQYGAGGRDKSPNGEGWWCQEDQKVGGGVAVVLAGNGVNSAQCFLKGRQSYGLMKDENDAYVMNEVQGKKVKHS